MKRVFSRLAPILGAAALTLLGWGGSPCANAQTVCVAEQEGNRVGWYDISGLHLGCIPAGSGPSGIVFDAEGNLYVSNYYTETIQKRAPDGQLLLTISGELHGPFGMIFDSDGNLLVCNSVSNTVRRFAPDGTDLGDFISADLSEPVFLAFSSAGELYVSNYGSGIVKRYAADGTYLDDFASLPTLINNIIFDGAGNLLVSTHQGIHRFSPTGEDLGIFIADLVKPSGMAFTPDGDLYVTNYTDNGMITRYAPDGTNLGAVVSGLNYPYDLALAPSGFDPVRWDVNRDCATDDADLGIVLFYQGACQGDPDPDQPLYNADADVNRDGCVDDADLGLVLAHQGE